MQDQQFPLSGAGEWRHRPYHRKWLLDQANGLFDFFQYRMVYPRGGFVDLDDIGNPIQPANPVRGIHGTARMVHCFAIGSLLGRPGSNEIVDHGMDYLWNHHRDQKLGGYFWALDNDGHRDGVKQGYGHAFVLLAASSAKVIGHPLADRMLTDVTEVLEKHFWEEDTGAIAEEFNADWSPIADYRGQNSNMHLTEALMAAFEATGEKSYLDKAERIANHLINHHAAENGFRVAEHFHKDWTVNHDFKGNEMFRPSGTTPGHWLEWSRLVLQLWVLGGKRHSWMPKASQSLFSQAIALGWDKKLGGFFYNLDWHDQPIMRQKLWWPASEGVGAAVFLGEHLPSDFHEEWYRRIWGVLAQHFIDHQHGGWHEELSEDLKPSHTLFAGKADIYHALQACLIPLYPATGSLTREIVAAKGAI